MSWNFFTKEGVLKTQTPGGSFADSDTLDGFDSTDFVLKAGDTGVGALSFSGNVTLPVNATPAAGHALRKDFIDANYASAGSLAGKIDDSGDTMTGDLVMTVGTFVKLNSDPVSAEDAVRLTFADSTYAALSGAVFTGDVELSNTANLLLDSASIIDWDTASLTNALGNIEASPGTQIRVQQDPVDANDLARKAWVEAQVVAAGNALANLSDVQFTFLADTQVLQYDASQSKWTSALPYWVERGGDYMNGPLDFEDFSADTDLILTSDIASDTSTKRFQLRASGTMEWGPGGSTAVDVNLYRGTADKLRTDDTFEINGSTIKFSKLTTSWSDSNVLIDSYYTVDAATRFRIMETGRIEWGASGVSIDTNLYRSAANTLRTDDTFVIAVGGGGKNELQITSTTANTGITIGSDVNVYRSAANILKTDDQFLASLNITARDGASTSVELGSISSKASARFGGDTTITREAANVLSLAGTWLLPATTVSANTTVSDTHRTVLVDTTSAARTITLPATPRAGQKFEIKDVGSSGVGNAATNNITVARNGNLIDGAAANKVLNQNGQSLVLISDGTNWFSIAGATAGASNTYNEVPSGTIDGANAVFTLSQAPAAGTERVFLNGLRQRSGAGNDYTISGATITFATAPPSSSNLLVDYQV